ncbi:MAG: ribokinase [Pseudorhodobacter sp.]|nr:ribokinase [Pseudorhodobacter sp.]
MTGRLIQLSGVIIDHIYRVESVPKPGSEAHVLGSTMAAGGGFNAMVAARRSGMAVAYGGTLGTGPFADIAARAMQAEGIAILRPHIPQPDQGCCTTLIDAEGERTFIACEGADGIVSDADIAQIQPRPGDWLLLSGYALGYRGSRDALTRWLGAAHNLPLVFDPSPLVAAIPAATLTAARNAAMWISANAAEAQVMTGLADPSKSAEALALNRRGGAVVRDGGNGCHLALSDQPSIHVPAYTVTAVDTNGAGDAHIGAFIAALARGDTPHFAARLANVAAALSITKEGPSTAPTIEAALAVMAGLQATPIQRRITQ